MIPPTGTKLRAAQLAHVLARAVRDGEVAVPDALRGLRHELRRRNTNKKLKIPTRSLGAQAVIDEYGEREFRRTTPTVRFMPTTCIP